MNISRRLMANLKLALIGRVTVHVVMGEPVHTWIRADASFVTFAMSRPFHERLVSSGVVNALFVPKTMPG